MATTDKSVQNQKVFVQLSAVLELQGQYLEIKTALAATEKELSLLQNATDEASRTKYNAVSVRLSMQRNDKRLFERTFKTLGLPVSI